MKKAQLVPDSGKVVVALSGGRDSMALLHVISKLKEQGLLKNIRVFHVNHGTRSENTKEEELVINYCLKLGVSLQVFHPNLDAKTSNFEHHAREKRYELFFNNLHKGEVLLTAHHIDDSFEWSLLRQFKSGSPNAALGIPVKNGRVCRPFNCVTKNQVANYVKTNSIPFIQDSSNKSIRFERNFIREKIIPQISQRFPGHLKHYVHRSNQLAQDWGVSSLLENKIQFFLLRDAHGILISHPRGDNDFRGAEEQIIWAITALSDKGRGTLGTQVEKIIAAARNGKKGPLLFSGNVLGHITHGALYFSTKGMLGNFEKLDKDLLCLLKKEQINFRLNSYEGLKEKLKYPKSLSFPFLTFAPDMPKNFQSIKKEHPLFPRSTEFGLNAGLWVNTLPRLLFYWERGPKIQLKEQFSLFNV